MSTFVVDAAIAVEHCALADVLEIPAVHAEPDAGDDLKAQTKPNLARTRLLYLRLIPRTIMSVGSKPRSRGSTLIVS